MDTIILAKLNASGPQCVHHRAARVPLVRLKHLAGSKTPPLPR
jgi:hypothetical protein